MCFSLNIFHFIYILFPYTLLYKKIWAFCTTTPPPHHHTTPPPHHHTTKAYLQRIRTQPHPGRSGSEARGDLLIRFKKKRKKIVWMVLFCPAQTKKQAGLLHQKPCTQIVQIDNKHYLIITVLSYKSYK